MQAMKRRSYEGEETMTEVTVKGKSRGEKQGEKWQRE